MKIYLQFMVFITLGLITLDSYAQQVPFTSDYDIISFVQDEDVKILRANVPTRYYGFSAKKMSQLFANEFDSILRVDNMSFSTRRGFGRYYVHLTVTTKDSSEYRIRCHTVMTESALWYNKFHFKGCGNDEVVLEKDIAIRWSDLDDYVYGWHDEVLGVYKRRAEKRARAQAPKRIRKIIGD